MIMACLNQNNLFEELLKNNCPFDDRPLFWATFFNPSIVPRLKKIYVSK